MSGANEISIRKKNVKSNYVNFGQPVKFWKQKYQLKIFYQQKVFPEVTLVLQKNHCKTITVPLQIDNLPKYTSPL